MNCIERCINCPVSRLEASRRPVVALAVSDMIFTANMMGIAGSFIVEFPEARQDVVSEAVKMGQHGLNVEELNVGIEALITICSNQCESVEVERE